MSGDFAIRGRSLELVLLVAIMLLAKSPPRQRATGDRAEPPRDAKEKFCKLVAQPFPPVRACALQDSPSLGLPESCVPPGRRQVGDLSGRMQTLNRERAQDRTEAERGPGGA